MSRGRACSMEKQTVASSGFSSFVAQRPAWRNHYWQDKVVPILNDCARKMLKTCSLECQKVLLKKCQISKQLLPKFEKLPPKFVDILI